MYVSMKNGSLYGHTLYSHCPGHKYFKFFLFCFFFNHGHQNNLYDTLNKQLAAELNVAMWQIGFNINYHTETLCCSLHVENSLHGEAKGTE